MTVTKKKLWRDGHVNVYEYGNGTRNDGWSDGWIDGNKKHWFVFFIFLNTREHGASGL